MSVPHNLVDLCDAGGCLASGCGRARNYTRAADLAVCSFTMLAGSGGRPPGIPRRASVRLACGSRQVCIVTAVHYFAARSAKARPPIQISMARPTKGNSTT